MAAEHRANSGALVVGSVAQIDRADLVKRRICETPVGVTPRRFDQVGQDRGPHTVQFGGDRIGQHKLSLTASKQGCGALFGEGPGQGLVIAGGGQGAARDANAGLEWVQNTAGWALHIGQWGRGQGVEASDACHFLNQIRLAADIAPPGRRGNFVAFGVEAKRAQDFQGTAVRQVQPCQLLHIGRIKLESRWRCRRLARDHHVRRLAATEVQDQLCSQLKPIEAGLRIDATGKAVLGV